MAPKFPPLTGRVVDDAGLLSPAARQRITGWLAQFEQATNLQVVVATVPTLHGYTIETYGYQLGRLWGFGKIGWNTGAILLVALKEHKVLIDIGYGFEAALPYALSETIIDQDILPSFRQSHYQAGILVGTAAILRAIGRNVASAAPTPRANGATNSCAAPTTVQEVVSCAAFSFSQLAAAPGNPFRDIEGDVATELSSLGWTIPPRVISYPGAFKKMEAIIRRGDERVMRRNQEIQAQSRETERQDRRDAEVWRDQEIQEELQETRDAAQDAANAAQWNQFNSGWPTYCQRYGRDSIYCY
ncbi:MAG: TPM domain-containing protein [Stellaceae bacterium]